MKKLVRCEGIYLILFISLINLLLSIIFIIDMLNTHDSIITPENRYQFEHINEQYIIFDSCTGDYWIKDNNNTENQDLDLTTTSRCSIGRYSLSDDSSKLIIFDTISGELYTKPINVASNKWTKIELIGN